jgi:hypothetical protein
MRQFGRAFEQLTLCRREADTEAGHLVHIT